MGRIRITVSALGIAFALAALPAIAGAAPPNGLPPQATLVRTDIFRPGPPAPGKPDAHGKPAPAPATANCSPDDPSQYLSTPAYTGSTSSIDADHTAHFNAATTPAGLSTAPADLQNAFNAWTTQNPNAPAFTVTTTGPVVTKATANRHTDVLFARTGGNTIAVTYTWLWSDGQYESDTVFSNQLPWAEIPTTGIGADGCYETMVKYDLQNIATHEFGHIYGLGHPANDRFATMYAYGYTGETLKRSPATSDQIGIDQLY
jgi:hypothetical protein